MKNTQPYVFVDIETTGTHLTRDRIIEIAAIRVENGAVVHAYNTLINPGVYVPDEITFFSGITAGELHNAPTFQEIKKELYRILDGAYFVAHNARFDYGFLKQAFLEHEMTFKPLLVCTVRLSRTLYPQWKHHDLSSLITNLGLICKRRHRAYDDAHVLWQFFQHIHSTLPLQTIEHSLNRLLKKPSTPSQLDDSIIERIPECPGVYFFYGKDKTLLYIGKAVNLKQRIQSHFSSDIKNQKEQSLTRQIITLSWEETAGELSALLLESSCIKTMNPLYNRLLRNRKKMIGIYIQTNNQGYYTTTIKTVYTDSIKNTEKLLGLYKSKKQAHAYLSAIADTGLLCKKLLGMESGSGACFGLQLHTCKGACTGKERKELYNGRFLIATIKNRIKPWLFDYPVAITESNTYNGKTTTITVDNWRITHSSDEGIDQATMFDMDSYAVLNRYLNTYYVLKKRPKNFTISIKRLVRDV